MTEASARAPRWSLGKTEQVDFHFPRALENCVTKDELVELITHLAFYAGWPNAMSAANLAKVIIEKSGRAA